MVRKNWRPLYVSCCTLGLSALDQPFSFECPNPPAIPSQSGGLKAHHGFLMERDNPRFLAAVDTGLGAPLIA